MELMRNKTEEDHDNFLEIIEEDYKWLRDKCEIFFQKIRLDMLSRKPQEIQRPPSSPVKVVELQVSQILSLHMLHKI